MDAVPCSTPVAHISKNRKKVRSFPLLLDHSEDALGENAQMEDALVPIRLDMEIEGISQSPCSGFEILGSHRLFWLITILLCVI